MALTNFKKNQVSELPERPSRSCHANGCTMAGSLGGTGSGWLCAYHDAAEPYDWPRVTEAIRTAEDIRLAINEVMKIDGISWCSPVNGGYPKWQEFDRLFDHKPYLQPTEKERGLKTKYEYRLRNELAVLAGLRKREKNAV